MSGWGGGYVTDINYTIGWYRQQAPAMIAIASIIGGATATIPAGDDPVQLLELGCGLGYGAMAQAASNPSWTVTGVDFNPAHIAAAREWAADAGLTNITFLEADLSRWEEYPALRALPEMDFVTAHGVWSWVPPAVQNGIVRLLGQKVRSGGLVHLSYNSLPGWQERIGVARTIREAGKLVPGRSDIQAQAGLRVQDLMAAGAHFTSGTAIADLVASLDRSSTNYLAHEFMNVHWAPCFGMDVAAALSDAKLEWIATGTLTDNFPELMLTEPQREIFNRYHDPLMQELIKDMCVPRGLRHDVFVRGARRMNLSETGRGLMDVHLTLLKPAAELKPDAINMPAGRAELNQEFYLPVVKALSGRPGRVGDLLKLPDLVGRRDNPAELISILIAVDMVGPCRAANVRAWHRACASTPSRRGG